MSNIICHIMNLKNDQKKSLIDKYKNYFTIIDLDKINKDIFKLDELNNLYKKYISYKNSKNNEYKNIDKEMFQLWKTNINTKLNGDKVIVVGCNYFRQLNKNLKINTNNKFIIKFDKYNIRDMIKKNLDDNYKNIIKGNYNLDNIDYDLLCRNEKKIIEYYTKYGYFEKSFNEIDNILHLINTHKYDDEGIWFASSIDYNKKVNNKKEKIIGFNDPLAAILYSFGIEYSDTIKISDEDIFKHKRYLYYLSFNSFIPIDDTYISNVPAIIIKKEEIKNVYQQLKQNKML
jgi:hypothetical protein